MQHYTSFLSDVERVLGQGVTHSDELTQLCTYLFPRYLGTFARDTAPQTKKGYFIVNLDTSKQRGSHWVAVADGLFYDSFGRALLGYTNTTEDDSEVTTWWRTW